MPFGDEKSIKKGNATAKLVRQALANKEKLGKSLAVTIDNETQKITSKLSVVDVNQAIQEINISWRKTKEAIINTAILLNKYKQSSNWKQIEEAIVHKHIMPEISLKQLLAIGQHSVLTNSKFLPLLPSSVDAMYQASKADEEPLKELFEKGKIKPTSSNKEIKNLVATLPRRNIAWDRRKEAQKKATEVYFTLKVTLPLENHKSARSRLINELNEKYKRDGYVFDMLFKDFKYKY